MSLPASQTDPIECLFLTILGVMVPFHLTAADGDVRMIQKAIAELVTPHHPATAPELELIGRMVAFGAAAMDNLRRSMAAGLSDRKVLQYRANAVALNGSVEQCRKALEAMQAKQVHPGQTTAMPIPMPEPKPAPVSPLPPAAPPPKMPPAQPQPHPVSAMQDDPEFAADIETMQRNTRAMLAEMQTFAQHLDPEVFEATTARIAQSQDDALRPSNASSI